MQEKKKKKKTTLIRTTQPRAVRLDRAKAWLPTYTGKNLVKGYSKKYRVDLLCAIQEVRLLGLEITTAYEIAVGKTMAQKIAQNRLKKESLSAAQKIEGFQEGNFEFVAGHTSDGVPFGIPLSERGVSEDKR